MNPQMSEQTRQEVLAQKRQRYAPAGRLHKAKIITELVELIGSHRKAAIRALRARSASATPFVRGRPEDYDPDKLLPPLKAIWLAALQPCGERRKAALPGWLPVYEADHRRHNPDVRRALLQASRATRPDSRLRATISIRNEWPENAPGHLEMNTVARCGSALDERHGWMFDAVDTHTTWSVLRGLPNRSEVSVGGQMDDLAQHLPFPLRGLDSAKGGEFISHQLLRYGAHRAPPVAFTRARAYHKNNPAHIEQKNYTHVRLWFGYERYPRPELWAPINSLCRGTLHQLRRYSRPTMKPAKQERVGSRTVRVYGPTQTPLGRVLACAEVSAETQA